MRYEIKFEANSVESTRFVVADSDEEALTKFREEWAEYGEGDEPPANPWIVSRWA